MCNLDRLPSPPKGGLTLIAGLSCLSSGRLTRGNQRLVRIIRLGERRIRDQVQDGANSSRLRDPCIFHRCLPDSTLSPSLEARFMLQNVFVGLTRLFSDYRSGAESHDFS
jgi:hypothetical protein